MDGDVKHEPIGVTEYQVSIIPLLVESTTSSCCLSILAETSGVIIVNSVMNTQASRPGQPTFVRDDGELSSQPEDLNHIKIDPVTWDAFMLPTCLLQRKAAEYKTRIGFFMSYSQKNPNKIYVGMNDGEILFWLDEAVDRITGQPLLTQGRWLKIIDALKKNHAKVLFLEKEGIL